MSSVPGENSAENKEPDSGEETIGSVEEPNEGSEESSAGRGHNGEIDDVPQLGQDVHGGFFETFQSEEKDTNGYGTSGTPRIPSVKTPISPEASVSTPDDTPSIQGSLLSSPSSSVPASHASASRGHHRPSLKPFERRFSSRLSLSPLPSPRSQTPTFLAPHSRQSSISSQLVPSRDESETPQPPWEVVRWTKLKRISGQVFSEVGKRNFGRATCLCVAASIIIGTSKGFILVFDYNQVLKSIIGPGTKAIECGSITSLAISADHSTVAGGHADGNIFTWELARPAKPFLHIPPLDRAQLDDRRSDGHISGVAILHLGFLATRHTALVSADDAGMAFSHLATRGLGVVARSIKTTRVLGRYPVNNGTFDRPRKPSSVLAFAPLPLGNVEQATDTLGLTALLTPYLLVIVSTTPIAQTQHKSSRPKELAPHSTLSGCLAWFPAVRLKNRNSGEPQVSKTKLAYCWSNILTILDVESAENADEGKPADLDFQPRSRWRSEEAIVAIQWLSRSVLGVLTISQRLVILEDVSIRMTDTFDLIQKHIFHQDLFSKQLQPVVEQLDEEDASMHGVVADAFYMSFRAYKSRLFLLGFNDVSIGTLSNWADRLLALMDEGDVIAALELATSYYNGDADKLTVGLPEDDGARHGLVEEKLLPMISASLRYTFSREESYSDQDQALSHRKQLASICFIACLSMDQLEVLFEEIYEAFESGDCEGIFYETLEPYILDGQIKSVPPDVLKSMITYYASGNLATRIEEVIIRLETLTMDIDQVTTLCRQYSLYDALIYVWNQALGDYVTPLVDLMDLIKLLVHDETGDGQMESLYHESAMKVFPYLAYSLTGRIYPGGLFMEDETALRAKNELYSLVFASTTKEWPIGSKTKIRTQIGRSAEPAFPYLSLLLEFDSASFMSMLNEAFEDSFLDRDSDANGTVSQANGNSPSPSLVATRQYVINILLRVITPEAYDAEDRIFFLMFLARNLAKYQHAQTINLPGSTLYGILVGLCQYPNVEIKEDCQLSVEYLLSVYQPSDLPKIIALFEEAGFHRVLKSIYRKTKQYPELLIAYLKDDDDKEAIFECISSCLRLESSMTKRQVSEFQNALVAHSHELASINAHRTAQIVKTHVAHLLEPIISTLSNEPELQYRFLQALIEPVYRGDIDQRAIRHDQPQAVTGLYVQLMCRFDPTRVSDFVGLLNSGDLQLDAVLPALEKGGVIDAAVVLMARDGLVQKAMQRLVAHLSTLGKALTGLIAASEESPDAQSTEESIEALLEEVEKYCKVGIWLCQGQTKSRQTRPTHKDERKLLSRATEQDLDPDELLWLDLLDAIVTLSRNVISATDDLQTPYAIDTTKISSTLRSSIQASFSALLAATTPSSTPSSKSQTTQVLHHPSFLLILRSFLTRASSTAPSLAHLRSVLSSIFATYAHEETILSLAGRFLDADAFAHVAELQERRGQGWRPRGQACEGCRRRAWGPGAGGDIWQKWERRQGAEEKRRREKMNPGFKGTRGKAREVVEAEEERVEDTNKESPGPLVVFACRHLWHRGCLDKAQGPGSDAGQVASSAQTRIANDARQALTCPLSH
ncbi:vacuolar assembly/sorting protein-like protein VPS8 [Pseudovirgaria hyperparasitica]|uniref:Vacuolar assembly/sorting protein-like protein VPS8 n=1 Tax=Pseudovirgaria hyperparasitica TaxID=470096 RepID=A0A6A6VWR9_9PEZI|nr:vacuolar assembly/sorting protein-like protein VPS8 [Pseudovirgaria hyperparasitica]KAF2754299.1 vacuolar assembly/sorting protein-like protein VPS8 [Pseudovirgaria hyperparasitica]